MVGLVTVTLCIVTYWNKARSGLETMVKLLNQQAECEKKMFLTATDLGDNPLRQSDVLCQLLSETLTHVVIDIVGTEQLLKGLHGVANKKKNHILTRKHG